MTTSTKPRPIALSLLLIVLTIAAGGAARFAPLGQPPLVMKYAGSALWAVTIYWVVTTIAARMAISRTALVAALIAAAVEFFKLYRSPGVDAFRGTLPGVLLLGRYFSVWDIVAYWIGIAAAAAADRPLRRWPRN